MTNLFTIRVIRVIICLSGGIVHMPMTQNEMVKLLLEHGGVKVKGGKGSHVKVKFPGVSRPIIVPKKLPKGTEHGILKQAGLK